jgi:hypothetical protein
MLGLGEKVWVVNFGLGESNDDCGLGAAGKGILQEEGALPLIPSSSVLGAAEICVLVSVDASLVPLTWANVDDAVGCCEQLNMNTQAQSVCSRCGVSGVINSCLELVITPRWLFSEVVVQAVCTLTTSSMLSVAVGCVGVGAQLLLVASTSVVGGVGF